MKKHYILPSEHGAWIWLLGPFALGAAAGGTLSIELVLLLAAGLFAFLLRQPISIVVKVHSGRRDQRQLKPALAWSMLLAVITLLLLIPLLRAGYSHVALLALPGIPVFGWHLWLVKRREERRQPGVEVVAAGVLSLMAPAAYWVSGGESDFLASALWGISWLQSAASIVHIHLRLRQRALEDVPGVQDRIRMGWRSLAYNLFNLLAGLALFRWANLPILVPAAFFLMLIDSLHGVFVPAKGYKPSRIGFRQLFFSSTFYIMCAIGMRLFAAQ